MTTRAVFSDAAGFAGKAARGSLHLGRELGASREVVPLLGVLDRILDGAGDAILILGEEGRVLWRNAAARDAFETVLGQTCLALRLDELWADLSADQVSGGLDVVSRGTPWSFRGRAAGSRAGHVTWEGLVSSAEAGGTSGPRFLVVLRDVSAQVAQEAQLARSANSDPLTGLPNRVAFRQRLDVAAAEGRPITLVFLDADHLKRANDTDGHCAGDTLLRTIASRLRAVPHPMALAARHGGDEFVLMIEDHLGRTDLEGILGALCERVQPEGFTLPFSASAGVTFSSPNGSDPSDLMQQAELALQEAKAKGRATWRLFDHEMRERQQARTAAIALLRRALDRGWVVPYYQPKVELVSGRVVGLEALLRICPPDGSLHTAGMVSEALRETDLAAEVDRVILRSVLADLRRWQDLGLALPVAVNVTDTNIRLSSFVGDLLGSMAAQGIGTSLLEVEITETVLLDSSVEAVQANLAALSRAGIRIALDDFGTGFASLAHLKSYPVDQFKIDRQFVQSVITSPDDLAIINAMVGLGESLVMQVVAEGIETEAQRRILIAAGCEYGQGHLFSQAIPAEAVPGLLRPV